MVDTAQSEGRLPAAPGGGSVPSEVTYWREVAAREKRAAAVHEAGHAAVVRHFGGSALPFLWRNPSRSRYQKAWLGTCALLSPPGTLSFDRSTRRLVRPAPAPRDWATLVGLAGLVAEAIDEGESDPFELWCRVDNAFVGNEVSATDAAMVGDRWTQWQLDRTARILTRRWDQVEQDARDLMQNPRPPERR